MQEQALIVNSQRAIIQAESDSQQVIIQTQSELAIAKIRSGASQGLLDLEDKAIICP